MFPLQRRMGQAARRNGTRENRQAAHHRPVGRIEQGRRHGHQLPCEAGSQAAGRPRQERAVMRRDVPPLGALRTVLGMTVTRLGTHTPDWNHSSPVRTQLVSELLIIELVSCGRSCRRGAQKAGRQIISEMCSPPRVAGELKPWVGAGPDSGGPRRGQAVGLQSPHQAWDSYANGKGSEALRGHKLTRV